MKPRRRCRLVANTFAALVIAPQLLAQQLAVHAHHYKLIDLGTLGGTQSYFSPGGGNEFGQYSQVLNERGQVAGLANTALEDPYAPNFCFDLTGDCLVTRAFSAQDAGPLKDLGALPNGASSAATWISANGLVAGLAQNGELDPLIPGFPVSHAVLWRKGQILDLGSLPEGGYESYAAAANTRGQVVGAALDTVPDPNSMGNFWLPSAALQTRAFLWEHGKGMQDLGTLAGSSDAQATLINEAGQVVGWSYTGSNPIPANACNPAATPAGFALETGSFIWEAGIGMRDLGGFGGHCTVATDLNDRGQIVGSSNLAGDQASDAFLWELGIMHHLGGSLGGSNAGAFAVNQLGGAAGFAYLPGNTLFHAVLWRHLGELTDLGVIGADQCSFATSINERLQIVGSSLSGCTTSSPTFRAVLWQDGALFDLNALIASDATLYLQQVETINNRSEIAGTGVDQLGYTHAFLLIPCDDTHADVAGCDYSPVDGALAAPSAARVNRPVSLTARSGARLPRILRPAALGVRLPDEQR
jgi:probable HAF family extracellular repeat protein